MLFIPLIIIFIISVSFSIYFNKKLIEVLTLSIVIIINILLITGIINISNILLYSQYFIIFITILSLIYVITKISKNKEIIRNIELLKGTIIYILLIAILYFINNNNTYWYIDEYTHWGTFVKYLWNENALMIYDNGTFNPNEPYLLQRYYRMGMTVWYYFLSGFSGEFVEWKSYFAKDFMYFSLMLLLFYKYINKKDIVKYIPVFLLVILLKVFDYAFCSYITNDYMSGVIFGVLIYYYLKNKNKLSKYNLLVIFNLLLLLINLRDIDILLCIGIILLYVLIIILNKYKLKEVVKYVLLLSIIIVFYCFWNYITKYYGYMNIWYNPGIKDIANIFKNNLSLEQLEIKSRFIYVLASGNMMYGKISNILISMFYLMFSLILILLNVNISKKEKAKNIVFVSMINAGYWLFIFVYLSLYLFSFSNIEGLGLISFERYMMPFTLFVIIHLMYLLNVYIKDNNKNKYVNNMLIVALLFLIFNYSDSQESFYNIANKKKVNKEHIKNFKNNINMSYKEYFNKNIYVISYNDNSNGIKYMNSVIDLSILNYVMMPEGCVKNKIMDHLIINDNIQLYKWDSFLKNKEDFVNHIINNKYEYLYIVDTIEYFTNITKDMFLEDMELNVVYEIVYSSENDIYFKKVI